MTTTTTMHKKINLISVAVIKVPLTDKEVDVLKWIKSLGGSINNAGGKPYNSNAIILSLEDKDMLTMTYFGNRQSGVIQRWHLTPSAQSQLQVLARKENKE